MSAEALLQRLDHVRPRGRGQWSARCPAHDDRGPSLSIRELDDGRVLLHDFGGCSVESVLGAVGLDMAALFPERPASPGAGTAPQRTRLPASQAIEILERETMIVALAGGDLLRQKTITETDYRRLIQAVARVQFIAREVKR